MIPWGNPGKLPPFSRILLALCCSLYTLKKKNTDNEWLLPPHYFAPTRTTMKGPIWHGIIQLWYVRRKLPKKLIVRASFTSINEMRFYFRRFCKTATYKLQCFGFLLPFIHSMTCSSSKLLLHFSSATTKKGHLKSISESLMLLAFSGRWICPKKSQFLLWFILP